MRQAAKVVKPARVKRFRESHIITNYKYIIEDVFFFFPLKTFYVVY